MVKTMIGITAYANADRTLIHEAGIRWIRMDFPFPFSDRLYGRVSEGYREARVLAERWAGAGFDVMGITPGAGEGEYQRDASGIIREVWQRYVPEWCGPLGSPQYLRYYRAACAWMAQDLRGLVSAWQIGNELDIPQFAGPLTLRQACELIRHVAEDLKTVDPSLLVGFNTAGPTGGDTFLYGRLFAEGSFPLDYCGTDGYFGTWHPGGPDTWAQRISFLSESTGAPVLINEWGFSSAGEVMSPKEPGSDAVECQLRKWRYGWGSGHNSHGQGEFVRAAFEAFVSQRSKLLGVFFYRWEDEDRCAVCHSPDCPIESAWGLVDAHGKPKPAHFAFQEGVKNLNG
jgi:hypothetical protein